MKVAIANRLPANYSKDLLASLLAQLETQLNLLAEGRLAGRHFTASVVPTTGAFAQGDIIWKTAPAEAGSVGAKYVNLGWVYTVGGSPGTLLEMRVLTGN